MAKRRPLLSFCWLCLEGVLLCAVLIALLAAAAAWRLSRGPVSLAFVQDDLERALSQSLNSDAVSVGAVSAAWSVRDRAFVVVLTDVEASGEGGEAMAKAPRIEAGLSAGPLLRGRLAFERLAAEGGELSIVRSETGRVAAGLGGPDEVLARARSTETDDSSGGGLEVLRTLTRSLSEVRLHGATLHIHDAILGIDWRTDAAEFIISREDQGAAVRAMARGDIAGRDGAGGFRIDAYRITETGDATIDLALTDMSPSAIAPKNVRFVAFSGFDAPTNLTASTSLLGDGRVAGAAVALEMGAGRMTACGHDEALRSASLRMEYTPDTDSLIIEEGRVDAEISRGRITGQVTGLTPQLLGGGTEPMRFQAAIDDLVCDLREVFASPLAVTHADIRGEADLNDPSVSFDTLNVDTRGLQARLTGAFVWEQIGEDRWFPSVRLNGPIEGVASHDDLLALWPRTFALGARDWLEAGVSAGRLSDMSVDIEISAADLAAQRLDAGVLRVPFSFDDASVRFVSTMSPLTQADGRGAIDGNSFSISMTSARMAGLELEDGFVEIPQLSPKGARARFGATASGEVENIITFIDEPPLGLASSFGLSPADFGGSGTITVALSRPMLREVPAADIGFDVEGVFEDVRARTPFVGVDVDGATVEIVADTDGLSLTGAGRLGPAPAEITWKEDFRGAEGFSTTTTLRTRMDARMLDALGVPSRAFMEGDVDVQIQTRGAGLDIKRAEITADLADASLSVPGSEWSKPAGEAGTARFTLMRDDDGSYEIAELIAEAEAVRLEGGLRIGADGRLERVQINPFELGDGTDLSAELVRGEDGGLQLDVAGYALDARALIAELASMGFAGGDGEATPMTLSARFGSVMVADDVRLDNVSLNLESNGERVSFLSFDADAQQGHLSATLASEKPGDEGVRLVTASAPDAGLVMRVLFGVDTVEGGALTVNGVLSPMDAAKGAPGRLDVSVDQFNLRGAPTLAQILTLGSFRGLADTLGGDGIAFDRLHAPITLSDGRITLDEARAAGSALGVTVSGDVDLGLRQLSLSGALAPAYSLNSLMGDVPLVGGLLVSREGEGVFGLTYSVQGEFEETRVFVNPLSAFAPGRLRRLFEGSSALEKPPAVPVDPTATP